MLTLIPFFFLADTYLICGNNPLNECMQQVNQCMTVQLFERGFTSDEAFEECAERINPDLVR